MGRSQLKLMSSSVIYGAPVGATPRRSDADLCVHGYTADGSRHERKESRVGCTTQDLDQIDPLGMREVWIKAREAVRRLAERGKAGRSGKKQTSRMIPESASRGMKRIRSKMELVRKDLGIASMERNHASEENHKGPDLKSEPPDRGKDKDGVNHKSDRAMGAVNQSAIKYDMVLHSRSQDAIKDQRGKSTLIALECSAQTQKYTTTMADQGQRKGKEGMNTREEVASNGKPTLGGHPLLRGGPSGSRGDTPRTPGGHGAGGSKGEGIDEIEHVVAPVFPISMGVRAASVVQLDLARERAAMRSRWIAVGLFFSVQIFGIVGLFNELKSKWGLWGRLNYTPLKNNRFLLEFEREGDL